MNDRHDLALLLNANLPIITVETSEETRALDLFRAVTGLVDRTFFQWKVTEGLTSLMYAIEHDAKSTEPTAVLSEIKKATLPAIYLLIDFHPYLADPVHQRLIKDIVQHFTRVKKTLVFISHQLELPKELRIVSAKFDLALPNKDQIRDIVREEASKWSQGNHGRKVQANKHSLEMLINNLGGLTVSDVQRLAHTAIVDDGVINEEDLPELMQAKYQLLNQDGILHFEFETEKFSSVGGFANLKKWLQQRQIAFTDQNSRLDRPKGVLLLGVQGCGKSLAAKSVAGVWGLPLLRFDFGALYNKYHGETERNLRESLRSAQVMAPCVLWIDEIEKGFSTTEHDEGTSKRVLGTFLTWLAENDAPVFVVATANDIQALPPELIRKGRIDEIFFVDLPDVATRAGIFEIHLRKREYDPVHFQVHELARLAEGFSGAEIEQAVVAGLYNAVALQRDLNDDDIIGAITATRPLSVVMAEKIEALRSWASTRTVPAN